jgi:hypothetical protein
MICCVYSYKKFMLSPFCCLYQYYHFFSTNERAGLIYVYKSPIIIKNYLFDFNSNKDLAKQ